MANYNRGENIQLIIYIQDYADTLVNPTDLPQLEVFAPDESVFQALDTMISVSTGIYGYLLTTLDDSPLGKYQVKYTVTDSAIITIQYDEFLLGR